MSSVQWDHTVHYVNNLDAVIAQLSQYGIRAFHGGTHPRWGTCNALSYFGLAYHEFLAIENLSLAQQTDRDNLVVHDAVQALPDHQVLSRVALRTTDIVSVYYRLKQQGIEVAPIITGKRLDKQGRPVEWKMMTPGGSFQGLRYPFIIEWQETDEQRLEHLHQQGIIQPHPAGEVALSAAGFEVENPHATARRWSALFDLPMTTRAGNPALRIGDKYFQFNQGNSNALVQLDFLTDTAALKGQTIWVGEGRYAFH